MSFMDEIRDDASSILTEGGFETESEIKFTSPDLTEVLSKGVAIRRTDILEYSDGDKKTSPFASICVPLAPFNFTSKYISLKNWSIEYDYNNVTYISKVGDYHPNYTLGIVNITLKDE